MPRRIRLTSGRLAVELNGEEYGLAMALQPLEDLIWVACGRRGSRPDEVADAIDRKRLSQGIRADPPMTPAEVDSELERLITESKRKARP